MKTVLLLPVALLIGSCSGSSDKIDADSDSLVAEKVETVEKDDFVSPDLLLFQLVGRVKCCITHCEYADTKGMMSDNSRIESVDSVYFSPKGLLTEMVSVFYNGDAVGGIEKIRLKYDADGNFIDGGSLEAGNDGTKIHIRRDADGYMTNYDVKCADADGLDDVYTSYIWKNGCLVEEETTYWEWQESVKYEYADAVVKSKTTLSTGYEEGTEIVETYAYSEFDVNGNWTRRENTTTVNDCLFDMQSGEIIARTHRFDRSYIDRRQIFYY